MVKYAAQGVLWRFPSGLYWLEEITLRQRIERRAWLVSEQFSIPFERLQAIIACESNWNPKALNPKDSDGFPKFGLLQFHKPTFYGAGGEDIWSWEEQLEIGGEMMSNGYWKRWPTCSRVDV